MTNRSVILVVILAPVFIVIAVVGGKYRILYVGPGGSSENKVYI